MASIETVHASNANLKSHGSGLVAIFVGGSSGLGETTAREFVRNTDSPKVYLVGRNQKAAVRITDELKALNPKGQIKFIQSDLTILKNVDKVCEEIKAAEDKVNLLFLSPGMLNLSSRDETSEGLDKKLNLNYYCRMRFTQNLLPLLTKAAETGSLSRTMSVLGAGQEGKIKLDDLSLKKNYSTSNVGTYSATLNSLAATHLATAYPSTTFIHVFPGIVKTNILSGFGVPKIVQSLLLMLMTPIAIPVKEVGERLLYNATSEEFAPSLKGGKGAYLLGANSEWAGKEKVLKRYREQGIAEKVWEHTQEVFEKVAVKGEKW